MDLKKMIEDICTPPDWDKMMDNPLNQRCSGCQDWVSKKLIRDGKGPCCFNKSKGN